MQTLQVALISLVIEQTVSVGHKYHGLIPAITTFINPFSLLPFVKVRVNFTYIINLDTAIIPKIVVSYLNLSCKKALSLPAIPTWKIISSKYFCKNICFYFSHCLSDFSCLILSVLRVTQRNFQYLGFCVCYM